MFDNFIISCESTADIEFEYFKNKNIPVIFYQYAIDGIEYEDNMGRNKKGLSEFYALLDKGKLPTTSQINEYSYYEFFKELVNKNKKILHIAFGSGLTPSVNNAIKSAKIINEELGEEKIFVVDSTCGSAGYGILVSLAYDFANSGKTIEQTIDYLNDIKFNVHHQFFSTDMKFFKRSGRVSGATATVATMLGICPIMHLNEQGKIIAYDKARGKRRAIEKTIDEMKQHAEKGICYDKACIINHSNCLDVALELKTEVEKTFANLIGKIEIHDIGNIIASHCGPGTVAIYFLGDKRV